MAGGTSGLTTQELDELEVYNRAAADAKARKLGAAVSPYANYDDATTMMSYINPLNANRRNEYLAAAQARGETELKQRRQDMDERAATAAIGQMGHNQAMGQAKLAQDANQHRQLMNMQRQDMTHRHEYDAKKQAFQEAQFRDTKEFRDRQALAALMQQQINNDFMSQRIGLETWLNKANVQLRMAHVHLDLGRLQAVMEHAGQNSYRGDEEWLQIALQALTPDDNSGIDETQMRDHIMRMDAGFRNTLVQTVKVGAAGISAGRS
jgi:hypothetical protein